MNRFPVEVICLEDVSDLVLFCCCKRLDSCLFVPQVGWDTASAQTPVQTFTLPRGIDYALRNNREFQVAQKDVKFAAEKAKEARAVFLPQLTLDTGYTFDGDLPTTVLSGDFSALLDAPRHKAVQQVKPRMQPLQNRSNFNLEPHTIFGDRHRCGIHCLRGDNSATFTVRRF